MATDKQKLFFCFLILNVTVVIVNFTGVGGRLWDYSTEMSTQTLTVLNTTTDSQSLTPQNASGDPANLHPFARLSKRLEQLE